MKYIFILFAWTQLAAAADIDFGHCLNYVKENPQLNQYLPLTPAWDIDAAKINEMARKNVFTYTLAESTNQNASHTIEKNILSSKTLIVVKRSNNIITSILQQEIDDGSITSIEHFFITKNSKCLPSGAVKSVQANLTPNKQKGVTAQGEMKYTSFDINLCYQLKNFFTDNPGAETTKPEVASKLLNDAAGSLLKGNLSVEPGVPAINFDTTTGSNLKRAQDLWKTCQSTPGLMRVLEDKSLWQERTPPSTDTRQETGGSH